MSRNPAESTQMPQPIPFRIFLASPGDVPYERQLAREAIEQVRAERRFRGRVNIELIAWDQPGAGVAMEAGMTPQESIARGKLVAVRYRRANTPGGTFFFTVVTFARRPLFDAQGVELLRQVLREVKRRHPFGMDAVVVLPDHLHTIWTLPPDDTDFSTRWMLIKSAFSRRYAEIAEICTPRPSRSRRREQAVWQRRFWEHQIRDERTTRHTWITFTTIPLSMAL